jgi:hypothetical protein
MIVNKKLNSETSESTSLNLALKSSIPDIHCLKKEKSELGESPVIHSKRQLRMHEIS